MRARTVERPVGNMSNDLAGPHTIGPHATSVSLVCELPQLFGAPFAIQSRTSWSSFADRGAALGMRLP
jgi:hypothetical protein